MRILSLLFISFSLVFSLNLTQEQLQLAAAAGYSKSDIEKEVSTTSKVKEVKHEQAVKNLFKSTPKVQKKGLNRFASMFFNNKNKLNPYSVPTPSNYSLNYGDKISLLIYGAQNQDFELIVNNNGNVLIPQLGELKVIGLSFSEVKDLIKEEANKAYPNSTNILVDMSEYTSIQITIAGFINAPGLYNLSSFSTIKDALIVSGGILNNGSYRNIYLKRAGKVKKVFDLYSLVRYGDSSSDIVLKSGDIILVKPISKNIELTGSVNYNASFELKNGENFRNLINFAAGLKPNANKNAIQLKRYENNSLKVYVIGLNQLYKMKPKSGDRIHVYTTSLLGAKLIQLEGNIVSSGEKELPKDKKLSTLLKNELKKFGKNAYFKNDTNYNYAVVKNDNSIKSFNLQKVLDKKNDITLKIGDKVIIYKNSDLQEKPYVFVKGEVINIIQNKYDFFKGMTAKDLFDLVKFNSDIKLDGSRQSIKVDRTKVQISRIINNKKLDYLVKEAELDKFLLNKFDEIIFFEFSKVNDTQTATIKGEVFISGTYDINKAATINELIKLAGGFTKKVLYSRFEIARYRVEDSERKREILTLDLKNAINKKLQILPDDEITIFPIANWNEKKYVELKGLVRYPGKYPVVEGEKLSSVISRAGGFLDDAFIEGAVFTRDDIRKLQQKRLEESIDRIKSKTFQNNLQAKAIGESSSDKINMINTVKLLEKESQSNKPIGRISLNLYHDIKRFKDSKYDIVLKDKDTLYIPAINDTVSVVGEVLNQNTFVYDSDLSIIEYIEKSGGLNESADSDYIYVVKANGEAIKHIKRFFWNDSTNIFKGDTIVVPLRLDTISDLAYAKDISSIVYQLAVTAASLKTLGSL